jgi:hypothetical protein
MMSVVASSEVGQWARWADKIFDISGCWVSPREILCPFRSVGLFVP